jgi:hypothetical protein
VTDFAELLYRSLPGVYRQKDPDGELQRFLAIMGSPLAEIEASIGQLYEDLYGATARGELLSMVGALIGADVDPTLPATLQRAALEETFAFHRSKGLGEPLTRTVQAYSSWTTVTVDYSQVVARLPHVESTSPLLRRRAQPVGVDPSGARRYYFAADRRVASLYDERRGRRITRAEIATLGAELIGTPAGFAIRELGVDLIRPQAPSTWTAVGADLTDFATPRTPAGAVLTLAVGQVAIDPELGRFLFAAGGPPTAPLSANLTVDFHQLVPASIGAQTFDLRDSARMAQLGRSDDPAPYSLDLRSSERPTDRLGRVHFDNHGVFVTVGQRIASQRPNLVHAGPPSGFTFDGRPLAPGAPGNVLMLQDGIDGSPITRQGLRGREHLYFDTPRGFTIGARGVSLADPAFGGPVNVRAAVLNNLASPVDPDGVAMTLGPRDIAVDPQMGRLLLNLSSFGVQADELRVGYLLASAVRTEAAPPFRLGPNLFAFARQGAITLLRNGWDGTPLSTKLRLGAALADFHGTVRGYRVRRNGAELTATLTGEVQSLEDPNAVATAGRLFLDLDRGRFAVPAGLIAANDVLEVDYSAADLAAEERVFASLAQRLPRLLPAGVSPVIVDTRPPKVDNVHLTLVKAAKT